MAKARDPLDSATSTSVLKDNDINRRAAPSLAELFRNIPGIRVEASGGEGNNSITVRGLPLVGQGIKYLSLQEDGLPVLQFSDFNSMNSDLLIRADLNVAQIESIRGGSASTFSSNAPGGVINLIAKTGEVEGGSIQASTGINYGSKRIDADYGGSLGEGWRFHVGGFFRQGEGPRRVGYDAVRGGQVKFNVTREFSGGYVRVYAKLLDDRVPYYWTTPVAVTGTNADSSFGNVANFDPRRDSALSRNISTVLNGYGSNFDFTDGFRIKSKSLGAEVKLTVADWTVTDRFRYSTNSVEGILSVPVLFGPAPVLSGLFSGGLGGTLTYASGPDKGQVINPATVNGNGLLALSAMTQQRGQDLDNFVNDLRASRVWNVGGGSLTTTAGVYWASQNLGYSQSIPITFLQDVFGGGASSLVDLTLPIGPGFPVTQNGILSYTSPSGAGTTQDLDLTYSALAPYGSVNYQLGKLALGGSVRYDHTRTVGNIAHDTTVSAVDLNGNGVISSPESMVASITPGSASAVNYRHGYLSYSVSANYRVSSSLSLFSRYSLGSRAAGDSILFSSAIGPQGNLIDSVAGHDPVRQLEGGFKFRSNGIFVNLTGFYALTRESAKQAKVNASNHIVFELVKRRYRTYGAEFDAGIRRGPFILAGTATLTGGSIVGAEDPTLIGNTPRHQPKLIYRVSPQFDIAKVTIGADIAGQTAAFTQDVNQLKMPGYTTVGAFVQVRPVERVELSVNASNLFNTTAYVDFFDAALPPLGVAAGRTLYGRLVSGSVRLFF